jgi:hypothetical protein
MISSYVMPWGWKTVLNTSFLPDIFIAPSTSNKQIPFLQEFLQADVAHMSFGKYTLYSVSAATANGTMSALGFAMLFGNEDKES